MSIRQFKYTVPYLRLTGEGKRLLRSWRRELSGRANASDGDRPRELLRRVAAVDRDLWMESLCVCDEACRDYVPVSYLARRDRDARDRTYFWLTKIGNYLLIEQMLLFRAYHIEVDRDAKKRLALFAMLKRVYDDLLDEGRYDPDLLLRLDTESERLEDPDYALLQQLRGLIRKLAPRSAFPNYYAQLERTHAAQSRVAGPEDAQEVVLEKTICAMLLDTFIMCDDLPEAFLDARRVTAEFISGCDDFYDMELDRKEGKVTYMNQADDPEAALREIVDRVHAYLRKNAPDPAKYISFTRGTAEYIVASRHGGDHRLHDMLHGE